MASVSVAPRPLGRVPRLLGAALICVPPGEKGSVSPRFLVLSHRLTGLVRSPWCHALISRANRILSSSASRDG